MRPAWYDRILAVLGLALIGVGIPFFVLVYSVGAPVIPFVGLLIATLGLWFLAGHRLSRDRRGRPRNEPLG